MVRRPWRELASLAAILAVRRLGTAIAAMMAIIATTIKSSTNEKPFSFLIRAVSLLQESVKVCVKPVRLWQFACQADPAKILKGSKIMQMFNPEKQIKHLLLLGSHRIQSVV